jgi:hypothetical protein
MFETSDGNERLINEFARAAPSPIANSLLYEIYNCYPTTPISQSSERDAYRD